jgi:hypothetical protein
MARNCSKQRLLGKDRTVVNKRQELLIIPAFFALYRESTLKRLGHAAVHAYQGVSFQNNKCFFFK